MELHHHHEVYMEKLFGASCIPIKSCIPISYYKLKQRRAEEEIMCYSTLCEQFGKILCKICLLAILWAILAPRYFRLYIGETRNRLM